MEKLLKTILVISFLLVFCGSANSTVIDFEGIVSSGLSTESGVIPSLSEDGFLFNVSHGHIVDMTGGQNGNGTDWFLHDSSENFTITRSDNELFSFNSFDAARWTGSTDSPTVGIYGWADGIFVNSVSISLTLTWTNFDMGSTFSAVDTIHFQPSNVYTGGYDNIVLNSTGSPVPEPATMMLFGIGLLGLAGVNRRKK